MPPATKAKRAAAPVFRVTKASTLNKPAPSTKQKLNAIEAAVTTKFQPNAQVTTPSTSRKRKISHDDEETTRRPSKQSKTLVAIPTPPASPKPIQALSETLEELKSLHASFTQALAVHYAHHGMRNSVSLSVLMPSMTRLWKKRTVTLPDIQRMLAVWELNVSNTAASELPVVRSPFKLVVTGIGIHRQTMLEHITETASTTFVENELHKSYISEIERLDTLAEHDEQLSSIINAAFGIFPRLKCEMGSQTAARQERVTAIKHSILTKPSDPDFSKLNISDASEPKTREEKLKSRTLGLFDRLKAKQAANATSVQQTPAELLRRRALHRMPEILDMLRLRQSQKLNTLFRSDLHGMPGVTRTSTMKVSFSLEQLVQEITDSNRTPVASDEIREAIAILGREVPDTWCSVFAGDGLKCVTLQGEGWKKEQVREWCQEELKRV